MHPAYNWHDKNTKTEFKNSTHSTSKTTFKDGDYI